MFHTVLARHASLIMPSIKVVDDSKTNAFAHAIVVKSLSSFHMSIVAMVNKRPETEEDRFYIYIYIYMMSVFCAAKFEKSFIRIFRI
jgi:hypothetical protein